MYLKSKYYNDILIKMRGENFMITLIISGGDIEEEFLRSFIKKQKIDKIIVADKGLEVLNKLNLIPNYIIGDFDSVSEDILNEYTEKNIEIVKLNPEKDYTDTHMALKLAIKLKSSQIYILGALGKRMDHAIANIHILKEALDNNIKCKIVDKNNEIELITSGINNVKNSEYKYISLIPLTTEVTGITLSGFKYLLKDAILKIGHSIGVSNEILSNEAKIIIRTGILIMVKSKD